MKNPVFIALLILTAGFVYADGVPDLAEFTDFDTYNYLAGQGEQSSDSNRLNTLGFEAYQAGDLYKAAKLWRCAIERDDTNAWAHYNFACALSLFAEGFGRDPSTVVPELEWGDPAVDGLLAYTEAIFSHLKTAVYYKGYILRRMTEDSDLDLIRNMKTYKFMLLYPDNDPSLLLSIIPRWYLGNYGVFPGGSALLDNGSITLEGLEFNDMGEPKTVVERGYYTQQGTQLTIKITSPVSRTLSGELSVQYDEFGFIQYFNLVIEGTRYSSTPDFSA